MLLGSCLTEVRSDDYSKPIKYGGPIVYSNEKPPLIHFPRPPLEAFSRSQSYGSRGKGSKKPPPNIQYVPLPHHDLPVLIYNPEK